MTAEEDPNALDNYSTSIQPMLDKDTANYKQFFKAS